MNTISLGIELNTINLDMDFKPINLGMEFYQAYTPISTGPSLNYWLFGDGSAMLFGDLTNILAY